MRSTLNAGKFYDALARDYHLLYPDWSMAISDQAAVLSRMIAAHGKEKRTVLDCACGIGTQALGLAAMGYSVTGTDISPVAVARAAREARRRGISSARFAVADLRRLPGEFQDSFDVAICCDNPLAHIVTAEELRLAPFSLRTALKPGGIVLLSSRDYDSLLAKKPGEMSFRHRMVGNRLTIVFQIWEWDSGSPTYINNHFILRKRALGWKTIHTATRMRAHTKQEIRDAFEAAGFRDVAWHAVEETGYFQPIMSAVSPS